MAASVAASVAAAFPPGEEASGLRTQAENLRLRAVALVGENQAAYESATAALRERDDEAPPADHRLGEAIRATLVPLLGISDSAADVAELSLALAEAAPAGKEADAAGAAALAEGAARTALTLIEINLLGATADAETAEAELNLQAAAAARERCCGIAAGA